MGTALLVMLGVSIHYIAFKILAALGVAIITYTAVDTALDAVIAQVTTNAGSLPSDTITILQMMGVGQAIGIILSALSFKLALQAFEGTIKKFNLV